MKKRFDTIKMVRDIREKLSRKTNKMSPEELMVFYREASQRVQVHRPFVKI